ncbi:winged helix-turn-helix transcriptional regulator [Methanobacterium alkalithermotolerans]|uniref:Winged helix-turn-helix transcriptional regulator n=1 Tax=Methanobacterium alkalithermotolerans TaxID=2731220 RepID=A0A8T8K6V6_9EURY|nr:metalloregulator ArsR/SmtB family transcription factor [Methanobacterium alkalithermotolerans]QUH22730.1 winged helix-turn-helix transcriptional regulator [Methanobacterium alkalithermotolerans]
MDEKDTCEIVCAHEEEVNFVKSKMLQDELLFEVSDNFKVFGDSTRLKILYALSQRELCVCDLAAALEMNQSAISHQLRVLRSKNLVKFKKVGKMAYYSLADQHVVALIELCVEHTKEKLS